MLTPYDREFLIDLTITMIEDRIVLDFPIVGLTPCGTVDLYTRKGKITKKSRKWVNDYMTEATYAQMYLFILGINRITGNSLTFPFHRISHDGWFPEYRQVWKYDDNSWHFVEYGITSKVICL